MIGIFRIQMMFKMLKFYIIVLLCIESALCYKPVAIIHGIMSGAPSMLLLEEEIIRV